MNSWRFINIKFCLEDFEELDQGEYYVGIGVVLFVTFKSGDLFSTYYWESDINISALLGKFNLGKKTYKQIISETTNVKIYICSHILTIQHLVSLSRASKCSVNS